jgi:hypothetical protein
MCCKLAHNVGWLPGTGISAVVAGRIADRLQVQRADARARELVGLRVSELP